ncbi:MAG: hypothetical protein FWE84_03050 [Firmicutes bacterium]|nr:hypothetical protein [Bacillota bacterium]
MSLEEKEFNAHDWALIYASRELATYGFCPKLIFQPAYYSCLKFEEKRQCDRCIAQYYYSKGVCKVNKN